MDKPTKTETSVLPAQYAGMKVRMIKQEGDENLWIPTIDINEALGLSEKATRQIISRNSELFGNRRRFITYRGLETINGKNFIRNRKLVCVNQEGLNALLIKIAPSRIKNQEVYQMIVKFQDWAIQTLTGIQRGNLLILHADLDDLLFIKSTIRSKLVQQKATEESLSPSAVYGRLRKYKKSLGIPRRKERADTGRAATTDFQRERELIVAYLKKHGNVSASVLKKELNLLYSEGSIRRIKRELEGAK